jgi:predicted ATPase/DNA-binding CsgD family transcriptional regulator
MKTQYSYAPATPFVGRSSELSDVHARLFDSACRLLTITGLGGSGKTRLAIEAARAAEAHFQHGVVFVPLQSISKRNLFVSVVAQGVGLTFYDKGEPEAQLLRFLQSKSLLLLLDNFDHLLDSADFISTLLAHAPDIKILVTSRESLSLREEWLYPLQGLSVPLSMYSTSLDDYDAVQLFLYHAKRTQPGFNLANEHEAIIRICRITEGLPLAIELVAMWLKTLSTSQIADAIQHNLDFLSTKVRNIEERHRSMRAVFDQSCALLSPEERLTFAKLSVFRGGFDLKVAEKVVGATVDVVTALIEKSLLRMNAWQQFEMHELMRQYGEEQLEKFGLTQATFDAHSDYFTTLLKQFSFDLKTERQYKALNAINVHFENVQAAWNWAVEARQTQKLVAAVDGLFTFYELKSRLHEGDGLLVTALEMLPEDHSLRSRLLARRASIKIALGQYDVAQRLLEESISLAQAESDLEQLAYNFHQLARTLCYLGDYPQAQHFCQQSITLYDERDDQWGRARCLHVFGFILSRIGNIKAAQKHYRQAVTLFRKLGDAHFLNASLLNLGVMCATLSENAEAQLFLEESLAIARKINNRLEIARALDHLGMLLVWGFKDYEGAEKYYEQSLALRREIDDLPGVAHTLNNMADIAVKMKDFDKAYPLYHEALTLFQEHSDPWNIAIALAGLGDAMTGLGQYDSAMEYFRAALQKSVEIDAKLMTLSLFVSVIILFSKLKKWELAATLTALVIHHPDSPLGLKNTAREYFTADKDVTLSVSLDNHTQIAVLVNQYMDELAQILLLPRAYLNEFASTFASLKSPALPSEALTQRELEILGLLATGLTNPQIAHHLFIGTGTVKTHTLSIYRKLDVANRTQAIIRGRELGLLST